MKEKISFICSNCGFKTSKWAGKCPNCGQWNTLKEYSTSNKAKSSLNVIELKETIEESILRFKTNQKQLDEFLGGGFVKGGVYLLAGSPGVGKSTLLLQICKMLQESGVHPLFITAEESIEQLGFKTQRIKSKLKALQTNDLDVVLEAINNKDFDVLVIDSIHTIYTNEIDSQIGSINQVRYCTEKLVETAKINNKALIIVSHITKEGIVAGPKALEHLVDAVFYLDSDNKNDYRLLKASKNRFASTQYSVIFEMSKEGLHLIEDSFLTYIENEVKSDGRAIGAILEGSYLLFLEIQALCIKTPFGIPRRTSVGFDLNRLNMLIAVIEKRLNLPLIEYDVYLNVIGGFKINTTLMDMAVIAAMVSSIKKLIIDNSYVFLGEIDLLGNVRKLKLPSIIKEKVKNSTFKLITQETSKNVKDLFNLIS